MNQPTREEFNELKESHRRLEEEVHKLREQMTEPITIPRIELDPGGIQSRLDNHADLLREISQKQDKFSTDVDELKIDANAYTSDAAIFKNKVERVESDVSTIKTDVNTLKTDVGTLKTDVEQVKTDVGTIKTIQNGHSKFFEEHGRRLNQTATKDDIKDMATKADIAAMATKADVSRLESMMQTILSRLPEPGPGA